MPLRAAVRRWAGAIVVCAAPSLRVMGLPVRDLRLGSFA